MSGGVLVVGSLHHDIMVAADSLPRRDETAVGHRWWPKFGGKGGNQAVAAARAGAPARMLGAVGDDAFGAFLRAGLRAGGVDDAAVATLAGQASGMSVAIADAAGDYAAVIVPGANLAIPQAGLSDPALWEGISVLLLQNEVPEALNLAAAAAARARGVAVVWNAAPARPGQGGLMAACRVVIVNAVEAEALAGLQVTDRAAAEAAALRLAGPGRAAVVTVGAQGLAAAAEGRAWSMPPEPVARVAGSHGAGDAFCGTLAAALAGGAGLPAACTAGQRAAARHVAGAA